MASLKPELEVKLDMDPAGFKKGTSTARKELGMFSKGVGGAESSVSRFKKTFGSIGRISGGIALFNVIRGVTHQLEGLVSTAVDFEKQMRNVNSVAQLNEKDFKSLTDQVIQLALDPRVREGPAELAAGLYEVTSAGYSTKDALIIMEQAALASTAGMTTSAVAADVLISTLGAYNLGVDQAATVTNQLFQIVNISKYTFEDLASSLATVTPVASKLGVGIDDIGAALATMAKQGVDADTATVQLNAVLGGLLKPTDALKQAMLDAGYSSGEAMIKAKGFGGTLDWLNGIIGGSAEKATQLFGDVRSLRGILQLTTGDGKVYAEMLKQMGYAQDDGGATSKALAEQMKSASFQMDVARKNIQILATLGFGLIAPYLSKVLVAVNTLVSGILKSFKEFRGKGLGFFESLRKAVEKNFTAMFGPEAGKKAGEWIKTIEGIFYGLKDIVEMVFPIVVKALKFLVDHFDLLGPGILGAVVALKALSIIIPIVGIAIDILTLSLSPLIVVMIAVAAVGAFLAIAWSKNWFDIRGKTKTSMEFIGKWLGKFWEFIKPAIDLIIELGKYFKGIATGDIQLFGDALKQFPGWLQPFIIIIARVIKSVRVLIKIWQDKGLLAALLKVSAHMRVLGDVIGGVFENLGFKHFADAIRETFTDVGMLFRHFVMLIDDLVHGRWDQVWMDLRLVAIDAFHVFIDRFKLAGALLIDVFNMIPWGEVAHVLWVGLQLAFQFLWDTGIPWMLDNGGKLIGAIWDGMKGLWDTSILPWLKTLPGEFLKILPSKETLKKHGNDMIGGLWDGISFAIDWGFKWFGKFPDWIKGIFSNAKDWLVWAGHEIMNGLWQGIIDVVAWIKVHFADLFSWMPDIVAHRLGIRSPSKVFAELGKEIPAGMVVGIKSGLGDVEKTLTGLAGTATLDIRRPRLPALGMVGGTGGANATINITNHIHGTADPDAVADRVVAKTMRAVRRRQAGLAQ
jgi:TP901 family phage tail tape measure protein